MTTAILTRPTLLFCLVSSGIISLLLAGVGSAAVPTVPRAFVSTTGSDSNPCSATQPCRSFNQALTVVEPGGEVVVKDSGGYSAGFTITQSLTIDAGGCDASVISTSATDLCTINAGTNDRVILRGISFHGANIGNHAIVANQVHSLYVEHCSIAEFSLEGVYMPLGGDLWVTDTTVRGCIGGVYVQSGSVGANLVVQDSRFSECSWGVFLQATLTGAASGLVTNSTATSSSIGFDVESAGSGNADLTLTNCRAEGNQLAGIQAATSSSGHAAARLVNCVVINNQEGIAKLAMGSGPAFIFGTTPASNLISGNQNNNLLGGTATALQ